MFSVRVALLIFILAEFSCANVSNNNEVTEINKPDKVPDSVDSRFFDLGGIVNQLFPGFTQGNQGGSEGNPSGMGFPANSQFYPGGGGATQGQYPQVPSAQGSGWPIIDDAKTYPTQGQNQGNFLGSQPAQYPNQGVFGGPQQAQYPNQGNFGGPQQSQYPNQGNFGGSPLNQYPNQGNGGIQQYPNQGNFGASQQGQYPNQGNLGASQQGQYPNQGIFGGWPQNQYPNQGNFGGTQQNQNPNQGNFGGSPLNQYPNQGNGWNQQYPNQGNFGTPQQGQYPNQGNFGGVPQNQNPNQGIQQYPNQGNLGGSQYQKGGQDNQNNVKPGAGQDNDGTLYGLLPPDEIPDESEQPKDNDSDDQTSAILGRPVIVPTSTTESGQIIFPSSTESPSRRQCVQDCQTTSEYNPVCGTNNVTYFNPGRFVCARNCGINVYVAKQGRCN